MQINGSADSPDALFYSNRGAGTLRRLVSWRNVASTRAGDFVCHYGESSGYSCAMVELTDYAPPGDAVRRPLLADLGDGQRARAAFPATAAGRCSAATSPSASPRASTARRRASCLFYYYMSTDYLPPPWRLLVAAT